jgi:hypothetical protein
MESCAVKMVYSRARKKPITGPLFQLNCPTISRRRQQFSSPLLTEIPIGALSAAIMDDLNSINRPQLT